MDMDQNRANTASSDAWPTEIRLAPDKGALTVAFDNGEQHTLTAEFLRVMSPSAEVQGHTPDQKKTVPGKQDVKIIRVEPVGNYAVRLSFDDMHDSGIFGWGLLLRYGRQAPELWQAYLDELSAKGLSRTPARRSTP
jgi:DUF971 family protein